DADTGELLALANYPSYVPDKRQHLTGEQLRNRALTDVFEPGSTMKPFTIGLALESGRVRPDTIVDTTPGRINITGSTISDTHNYGVLTAGRVIPATLLKTSEPAIGVPVFSERTADQVRKMLQMAAGPGGTGQKAQTLGYSVGGKSGTARKQVGKNYAAGKYRAWFTGMAPI